VEEDWLTARNYCRRRCMDSVSLETSLENEWIKQYVVRENVSTNFRGYNDENKLRQEMIREIERLRKRTQV